MNRIFLETTDFGLSWWPA